MLPARERPPVDANERASLLGWLDLQRSIVHWKCEGLTDVDAQRVVLATSPHLTVAGVVSHLRWDEHCWFEVIFLGHEPGPNPQFREVEDADFLVEGRSLRDLLHEYAQQCRISNEIIANHPLEEVGLNRDYRAGEATLRWMLHHMLEETARHLGHLDLMRELLDGEKGYY